MKRTALIVATIAAAAGCSGGSLSLHQESLHQPAGFTPGTTDIGSMLLCATEAEWRKEIDIGPQQFDDGGMPVVAQAGARAKTGRHKRFGFCLGFLAEANVQEDIGDVEFKQDGPVVGLYMRLGGKGRIALEVGYESLSVASKSNSMDRQISNSNLHTFRADAVYFLSPPGTPTRLYGQGGGRHIVESVEIYTNNDGEQFTNSASGWGIGVGIQTNQFDLKIEHFEVTGPSSGVGFTAFTAAYRF